MKSMTGYAKRQMQVGVQKVSIEIKTLNSKQLDLNVKLPNYFRELEIPIRTRLGVLERGKVDVIVTFETTENEITSLNKTLVEQRMSEIEQLDNEHAWGVDKTSILSVLLGQAAAWDSGMKGQMTDEESEQFMQCFDSAIAEVEEFRQDEGNILRHDIDLHVNSIENFLNEIPAYEQQRIQTAKERIYRYFNDYANNDVNKDRFEQELIYYLEKLDITEEKVRLKKHIDYFRQTMNTEPVCGKKLGFIAQEMGREINTTGSKANSIEIQRLVVQMKDELEKIKEQLGNIL